MPAKSVKPATSGRGEQTKEEPLQAVILLDSFEEHFQPFTLIRPRCLLPLNGIPIIEYTLDYLASCGVQDVYLYASNHIEQVDTYINTSSWITSSSPFRKCVLLRSVATSIGDLMRDLDSQQIMKGDFLCVSGDIVSDFPIHKALRAHKLRRAEDKNAIMTMILRERGGSDVRHRGQTVSTFVIEPSKDRCLQYEEVSADDQFGSQIDLEMLKQPELDLRQDLIDCRIDICTPDVLSLWSDNFDNQRPRKDFLFGVLKDYELNGKTIHTYIVEDHYVNRIADLSSYVAISEELRSGMVRALSACNSISGSRSKRLRNNIIKGENLILQRPVKIDNRSTVGDNTSIGANSSILNSVVGQRCQISKNTRIENACLWDDVTVGSNVQIGKAIVGSEAFIGNNSTIEDGCLIDIGSKVPANTRIGRGMVVTKSTSFANGTDSKKKGDYFEGSAEDEMESKNTWSRSIYSKPDFNDSVSSIASDESDFSAPTDTAGSRSQSFVTHASDEDQDAGSLRFLNDTTNILVQRMQEGRNFEDMQSELMGLRFSGGADGSQVQRAVSHALARHIHNEVDAGLSPEHASRRAIEQYRYLVRRQNVEQSVNEQIETLLDIQLDLAKKSEGTRIMPFMAKDLYDLEVLEEEAFTSWFAGERSQAEAVVHIRDATKPFIDWLDEAEEEDSEDDDSDE